MSRRTVAADGTFTVYEGGDSSFVETYPLGLEMRLRLSTSNSGGGTLENGRVVNYKVDGMPVSREYFRQQLDSAFPGGEFLILEARARL